MDMPHPSDSNTTTTPAGSRAGAGRFSKFRTFPPKPEQVKGSTEPPKAPPPPYDTYFRAEDVDSLVVTASSIVARIRIKGALEEYTVNAFVNGSVSNFTPDIEAAVLKVFGVDHVTNLPEKIPGTPEVSLRIKKNGAR